MLNQHIGIGIPWDLDRQNGGVTILSPHVKGDSSDGDWYSGTANAVFQNIEYIDSYNPIYVLVLGTDHIYKMDYSKMLDYHIQQEADVTISVIEVDMEEATRMGIMNTNPDGSVYEFEEKPANPKSNLASMGMYIFTWDKLREALIRSNKTHKNSDFGKHIIPMMLDDGQRMFAYKYADYWKDIGTIEAYWQSNMELVQTVPVFNLYDEFWPIYTDAKNQPPQYSGPNSDLKKTLLSEGCEIYGIVHNCVLGQNVYVAEGAKVFNSIIMANTRIEGNTIIDRCIIDENTVIGESVVIGTGENIPNIEKPNVYDTGITVIGENTVVPSGVEIGKNCVIKGVTENKHYLNNMMESGQTIIVNEDGEVVA
jgi:glucose-1-phosphate adenylyltransferase